MLHCGKTRRTAQRSLCNRARRAVRS